MAEKIVAMTTNTAAVTDGKYRDGAMKLDGSTPEEIPVPTTLRTANSNAPTDCDTALITGLSTVLML
jgi:Asp/Glu/hydantoin racemase